MIKLLHLMVFTSLALSACVAPEVVTKNSVGDQQLSCTEISTQLVQLEEIRKEAAKGQTASGQNVAAAIFFWPAVIGNYQNAKQALEAANARHDVLLALAQKKGCAV
ncbi:hypothetical protein [Epibacterium ulvae]|uniref:hypothetical protein n=1 Tax=Epibacterium ulvae TaxID=1156985 RepID=UPI00248FCC78|nr:hypothetical protein [Epibacterium ulvae]